MSELVTNELIYSVLQKVHGQIANINFDLRDLKTRMTMVGEDLGRSILAISGVNSRLDRLTDRFECVERRLDLREDAR